MGFLSMFTNTGKTVADKAKDLGNVTRLNAKIAAEEAKKSRALAEIGRLFYEKHKDEMGNEYLPYSAEAASADREIAVLKEQLLILRGVRACKYCGAQLDRHDIYCPVCGKKADFDEFDKPKADETPKNTCPVCQSEVPEGTKYCPTCGEKLTDAPEPVSDEAVSAFAVDTDESPVLPKEKKEAPAEDLDWNAEDEPAKQSRVEEAAETVSQAADNAAETVGQTVDEAAEAVNQAAENFGAAAEEILHDTEEAVNDAAQDAADATKDAEDAVKDAGDKAAGMAESFREKAADTIEHVFNSASETAKKAADSFEDVASHWGAKDLFSGAKVKEAAEDLMEDTAETANRVKNAIHPEETAKKVEAFADEAKKHATEIAGSVFSYLGNALNNAADALKKDNQEKPAEDVANMDEEAASTAEEVESVAEDVASAAEDIETVVEDAASVVEDASTAVEDASSVKEDAETMAEDSASAAEKEAEIISEAFIQSDDEM